MALQYVITEVLKNGKHITEESEGFYNESQGRFFFKCRFFLLTFYILIIKALYGLPLLCHKTLEIIVGSSLHIRKEGEKKERRGKGSHHSHFTLSTAVVSRLTT